MKTHFRFAIILLISFTWLSLTSWGQCDPMSAEDCPDPENNGQVCPDSLAPGFLNTPYTAVVTILPPSSIDTLSLQIDINHITLDSITHLPNGLTWVSNAVNNEFYPDNYYCVLIQGTPTVVDTFRLKIYIAVFVELLGDTLQVAQLVDSTSVAIVIQGNSGIQEHPDPGFYVLDNSPNPFTTWTSIRYFAAMQGPVELELYSLLGDLVDKEKSVAVRGENYFHYFGERLSPGTYFYLLKSNGKVATGKVIRGK